MKYSKNTNLKGGMIIGETDDGTWVRLDDKTLVHVRHGQDIQAHIDKFLNRRGGCTFMPWVN